MFKGKWIKALILLMVVEGISGQCSAEALAACSPDQQEDVSECLREILRQG